MKLQRLFAIVLSAAMLALCAPALAQSVTVTDMWGREITLEHPAERMIVLTPADCEILYALDAQDAIIARGEYCDYPAEVSDIPTVQSGYEMNIEQIVALQPDVILTASMDHTAEQIAQLESLGIPVVESDADSIEGTYTEIAMIGTLTGREAQAQALIDDMKASFAEVTKEATGKTVYFEVSPLEYGLWTAGAGTFMNEIAELMGLTNIFADVDGWSEVSEEQVLARNPDYIVTISMYYGEGPTPAEEICARPGWESVTAVKDGKVLNLQNNELSRPTPRLAEGARMLYDFVYGE